MNYILFNAKSKNGTARDMLYGLRQRFEESEALDVLETDYAEFFAKMTANDTVVLLGGDGTLNHFVNRTIGVEIPCKLYFMSAGTGNDFLNDMKDHVEDGLIQINDAIKNLPTVTVNGKDYKFINGVGFGIDGYCCEVGDDLQAKSDKPVNYTSIAIKGLLFHYKRPNAKITVDGKTYYYRKVWLAPTMKGRFYGGGMMVAPAQDRFNGERLLTNVVMHKAGKIKTLLVFKTIFEGKHISHTEMVDLHVGKSFKVEFDRPTALQIDGETFRGVTEYEVRV